MPTRSRTLALQLRTARRLVRQRKLSARAMWEPLNERMVFVMGCPRSGTTFLARSLGSCAGFIDLGEVAPFKAALPELAAVETAAAAQRIRRILSVTRRLGLVGSLRAIEQTPESAFVAAAVAEAFPEGRLVHIVRDGRDVVCSLLERGWLSAGRSGTDDAGHPYGSGARFWLEPGRGPEFEAASDTRRAAWAWRRYVQAVTSLEGLAHEVRYEALVTNPRGVAMDLAASLEMPSHTLADALSAAFDDSVGRYRRELTAAQLEEVQEEAGKLLAALGYLQ